MAQELLSNLILQTSIPAPTGTGFKKVASELTEIKKKLDALTSKPHIITLQVQMNTAQVNSALAKLGLGGLGGGTGSGVPGGIGGFGGPGVPAGGGALVTNVSTTGFGSKKGPTSLLTKTLQETQGEITKIHTEVTNLATGALKKISDTDTDLRRVQTEVYNKKKQVKKIDAELKAIDPEVQAAEARRSNQLGREGMRRSAVQRDALVEQIERSAGLKDFRRDQRLERGELSAAAAAAEVQARSNAYQGRQAALAGAGFQSRPEQMRKNAAGETINQTQEFFKQGGNAVSGFTVEIVKLNKKTGEMSQQFLDGSRAIKYLGDSLATAVSKVGLWLTATTGVFAVIQLFKQAAAATLELEQNTVFLARVGVKLGEDWTQQLAAAHRITDAILEMTTVIGGNAAEAQKAAAIFARSGQTEKEVLTSVKAALIASKIAELDVVDAANLLSAAQVQFKLKAADILPTLNSLNVLSNTYRITTNDLLQSISRTGSIYEEHGGRLQELAAITAIVGQATSRTGAEIGNALKTISSNLDQVKIQQDVFHQLGISASNTDGSMKSLLTTLVELNTRMNSLSETDRRALTIQIAGVRQRNNLVVAIRDVSKEIVAFNQSVNIKGENSALDELTQRSHTLQSSLERLYAAFIQLANSSGKIIGPIVQDFANLVAVALKVLNSFNGLGVKLATLTTILLSLSAGLRYLGFNFTFLELKVALAGLKINWTSLAAMRASLTFTNLSRAVGLAQTAFLSLLTPANVAAVAILAVGHAFAASAEAAAIAKQAEESAIERAQRQAAQEKTRAESIRTTTQAIIEFGMAQEKMLASGDKEGAAKKQIEIHEMAASAGIALRGPVSNEAGRIAAAISGADAESFARNRERTALENEIKALNKRRDALREEREVINAKLKVSQDETKRVGGSRFAEIAVKGYTAESEIKREAIDKIRKEIRDKNEALRKMTSVPIDAASIARLNITSAGLSELSNRLALEKKLGIGPRQTELQILSGRSEIASNKEALRYNDKNLQSMREMIKIVTDLGVDESILNEYIKQRNDLLEDSLKLQNQISAAVQRERVGFFRNVMSAETEIVSKAALIRQSGKLETSDRFLGDNSTILDDLKRIELRKSLGQSRLQDLLGSRGALGAIDTNAKRDKMIAIELEAKEQIVQLADLEKERVLAILDAEKQIAVERKRSADEAARALGILDEESKLDLLAQAQFFANNPNRRISVEEQFLAGGRAISMAQQFFPGKLESGRAGDPIFDLLTRAGFGRSEELNRAESSVRERRGGQGDFGLINGVLETIASYAERAGVQGGFNPLEGTGKFARTNIAGGFQHSGDVKDQAVRVQVSPGTFDLKPLIDGFEEVMTNVVDERIKESEARIRKMAQDMGKTRFPKTSPVAP